MKDEKGRSEKEVTIVALITALCLLGDSMLYVALPLFYREAGLESLWEVGLILSLNRFVRIPINPIVGWVYRRLQLRTGLSISVILAIVTTVGYGVGSGLLVWILLRLVWGVAWSFLRLGGFYVVLEVASEHNRGEQMGRYNGLYRLGSLGGMIGGGLLVNIIGFNSTAILFGLLMLIGLPLVYITIPKIKPEKFEKPPVPLRLFGLTRKCLAVIMSGLILAFLIQGFFTSSLTLVMADHFGSDVSLIGVTIGITALAGILQGLRWLWEPYLALKIGVWSDGENGRLPLFLVSLGLSSIGFYILSISLSIYLWMIILLVVMMASTALTTLIDTLATDVAKGENAKQLMTTYIIFLDIGAAFGPIVTYMLLSFGMRITNVFTCAAVLFICLFAYWFRFYRLDLQEGQTKKTA
ncbi:MFS transporter [Bacillus suaedae]|uniref:MFS transporter n=1 Tax=Halalkalibacter suaedae TaxID=2822140 RepID=A0A940X1Q8_9BACI|nr:MFS transporter [Bacillus suaedae]